MLGYVIKTGYSFLLLVRIYCMEATPAAIKGFLSFFDSGNPDTKSATIIKKRRKEKDNSADQDSETDDTHDSRGICCANCYALLTHTKHAIAIEGKHRHIVTNPNGITFNIGTYRQVDCTTETGAENEFSWFTGYAWRVIVCPGCRQHIGWSYQKADSPDFYGLITDKLIDFDK